MKKTKLLEWSLRLIITASSVYSCVFKSYFKYFVGNDMKNTTFESANLRKYLRNYTIYSKMIINILNKC